MDRERAYEQIINLMNLKSQSTDSNRTTDDEIFRSKVTEQLSERDIQYTELLKHFVELTKIRLCIKEFFKWVFCFILFVLLVSLMKQVQLMVSPFIVVASKEELFDAIPLFVCVVGANANYLRLANATFIKKVSHSSKNLREDNIVGNIR